MTGAVDGGVTAALQSVASFPLDLFANLNTLVGQATVTSVITIAAAAWLWRREPSGAWLAAGFFALTVVGELALKYGLDHPAPPLALDRSLWDPLGVRVTSPSSFPSGHVARVTFLAILGAGVVGGRLAGLLAVAVVAYTMWARVYLGDHWISDVLGGLALGGAAGFAALAWIAWRRAAARPAARWH